MTRVFPRDALTCDTDRIRALATLLEMHETLQRLRAEIDGKTWRLKNEMTALRDEVTLDLAGRSAGVVVGTRLLRVVQTKSSNPAHDNPPRTLLVEDVALADPLPAPGDEVAATEELRERLRAVSLRAGI